MTGGLTSGLPAVLVEAFSQQPCHGNGAAVVLLPTAVSSAWMQGLARSLNQSETAFLLPAAEGWLLRWFTPSCEVPLCGHATLASLLALEHWGQLPANRSTVFHTRSGPLSVAMEGALGTLHLPAAALQPAAPPAYLKALLEAAHAGPIDGFWRSNIGYSVVLLSAHAPLPALAFNPTALEPEEAGGLIVMQPMDPSGSAVVQVASRRADYQLRFFAPGLGITEDPVTGSAHALVAPYWIARCQRPQVVGWQCSGRSGGMLCETASSGMIRLRGEGSLLWDGRLQMHPDSDAAFTSQWHQLCCNA